MSQFWDAVALATEDLGVTAEDVLADADLLEQVCEEAMNGLECPFSFYADEAGMVHQVNDGESFVCLAAGRYDTTKDDLTITTFDFVERVRSALTLMAESCEEE